MTKHLKIRKFGNSLGVVLPKELLADLQVGEGDLLYPLKTSAGIQLSPYDPDFADAMDDALDYMRRHKNAMKALADS